MGEEGGTFPFKYSYLLLLFILYMAQLEDVTMENACNLSSYADNNQLCTLLFEAINRLGPHNLSELYKPTTTNTSGQQTKDYYQFPGEAWNIYGSQAFCISGLEAGNFLPNQLCDNKITNRFLESGNSSVVTRWSVDQEVVGSNPSHGRNSISVVCSLFSFTQPIR